MTELFNTSTTNLHALLRFCLGLANIFLMVSAPALAQGVRFVGGDHPIEDRTALELFSDNPPQIDTRMVIHFDLQLPKTGPAGYIIRVQNTTGKSAYNLYYDQEHREAVFRFNEEGKNSLMTFRTTPDKLQSQHWIPVRLVFDLKQSFIEVGIGDLPVQRVEIDLEFNMRPRIAFGKSDYFIDVPAMVIRDIRLHQDEREWYFPLREIAGGDVHEVSGEQAGHLSNGTWLLNAAFYWKNESRQSMAQPAGSIYDEVTKSTYYFTRDSLKIFNVQTGQINNIRFADRCPVPLKLAETFIDPSTRRLYVYETSTEGPYLEPTVASLDLQTYIWREESHDHLHQELHHHGSVFLPQHQQLFIFGGFGQMKYSDKLFRYSIPDHTWMRADSLAGESILPRYFTSMGYSPIDQQIYLFGGMGNQAGEHIVGRKYLYDLYRIDPTNLRARRLWQKDGNTSDFVPARGLVIPDTNWVYLLGYPEHLTHSHMQLRRFSLSNGAQEVLGDSIPIYSDRISTKAQLFYDRQQKKLVALVQESPDDVQSSLSIYSLDFPAIPKSELNAFPAPGTSRIWWWIGGTLAASALLAIGIKRYANKDKQLGAARPTTDIKEPTTVKPVPPTNAIYLFGDFTVIDKNGENISHLFSARLKQVFLLILFHSREHGISSQHLSHSLWPDKPKDKVKTSRGVAINSLRKILAQLDHIDIVYEQGLYKLKMGPNLFCDYAKITAGLDAQTALQKNDRVILTRGEFLQGMDDPLFDREKAEMESRLTKRIIAYSHQAKATRHWQEVLDLSKLLLSIDPLQIQALELGLESLFMLKRHDDAERLYSLFNQRYEQLMGEAYAERFEHMWDTIKERHAI